MEAEQQSWSRRRLNHLPGLRVRITAAAVLVVALALAAGSVVLVTMLHNGLVDSNRSAAKTRAATVAAGLSAGSTPSPSLLAHIGDHEFVQILDPDTTVLAATENAQGQPNMLTEDDQSDVRSVPFDDHRFVIVHKSVTTPNGRRTVVAGVSLDDVDDATASLTSLLLIGSPILLLVMGAMTWFVVGRTLAPVSRIRREADDISASELDRRVPEPARHDEIGRLARTINLMLARLEHAQQQQRRFISDAAHELRSPIAAIKQNAEVATAYPEHLSTEELLETVLSESARLERLTNALLALARLDEHAPQRSDHPVDLDDLVLDEVQRLKTTTSLQIDATAVSAGRVGGDASLLAQVLRNLIDNAERHATTTIALTLAEHDQSVTLSVEDDGPGVPAADRERIFERFVRLDEARARDHGGSGLGLAIVHQIITSYGGTIVATTSRLGGARMTVMLPRLIDAP